MNVVCLMLNVIGDRWLVLGVRSYAFGGAKCRRDFPVAIDECCMFNVECRSDFPVAIDEC